MRIIFCIIFAFNIGFSQGWINYGTWSEPVSGGEAIADDSVIYVLGGFSESRNSSTNEIRIYSVNSNHWKNKTNMTEKRSYFASGVFNDTLYYFGGIPGNDDDANSIEMWNKVNKGKEYGKDDIFNRTNTTGIILNNIFYFFGGNCGVSDPYYLVEYDIPEKEINYYDNTTFTSMPAQQMCTADGRYIYLFGGVFLGISKNIYRYDLSDKSFTKLNINLNTARAGGRAIKVESDKILIIGGYNETINALQTTEIFTITNGSYTITQGPALLQPRKDFMAVNLNGSVYVLGGVDSGSQAVNTIEKLDGITAVSNDDIFTPETHLDENYPNPFNPATSISFSLSNRSFVKLVVYDITGKEIVELISKEMDRGKYNEQFNAGDYRLSSGIYLYRLSVDGYTQTRKMVLLK